MTGCWEVIIKIKIIQWITPIIRPVEGKRLWWEKGNKEKDGKYQCKECDYEARNLGNLKACRVKT